MEVTQLMVGIMDVRSHGGCGGYWRRQLLTATATGSDINWLWQHFMVAAFGGGGD